MRSSVFIMLAALAIGPVANAQTDKPTRAELQAEVERLRKENAELKAKLQKLETKAKPAPALRGRVEGLRVARNVLLGQQAAKLQRVQVAAPLAINLNAVRAPVAGRLLISNQLLAYREPKLDSGEYGKALATLDKARRKVDTADEPAAALAGLDDVLEALTQCRTALWDREKTDEKQAKDTVRGATAEVTPRVVRLREWVIVNGALRHKTTPEFLKGEVGKALEALDAERKKLSSVNKVDDALEALDEATKATMRARRLLGSEK